MWGRSKRLGLLSLSLAAVIALAGCGGGGGGNGGGGGDQGLAAGGNVLDPDIVAVGDIIGEFEVTEVGQYRDGVNVKPNMRVVLTGRVEVTGEFSVNSATGRNAGQAVFTITDEASLERVPRVAGDREYGGFLLADTDKAKELFGPPGTKGTATAIIDNYVIVRYSGAAVSDNADVLEVISKELAP